MIVINSSCRQKWRAKASQAISNTRYSSMFVESAHEERTLLSSLYYNT